MNSSVVLAGRSECLLRCCWLAWWGWQRAAGVDATGHVDLLSSEFA
jgi:hypothetical protein